MSNCQEKSHTLAWGSPRFGSWSADELSSSSNDTVSPCQNNEGFNTRQTCWYPHTLKMCRVPFRVSLPACNETKSGHAKRVAVKARRARLLKTVGLLYPCRGSLLYRVLRYSTYPQLTKHCIYYDWYFSRLLSCHCFAVTSTTTTSERWCWWHQHRLRVTSK